MGRIKIVGLGFELLGYLSTKYDGGENGLSISARQDEGLIVSFTQAENGSDILEGNCLVRE